MKVAIEARALKSLGSGVRTYVKELVNSLPEGHEFKILEGPKSLWQVVSWMNVILPHELGHLKPDVVHFTKAAVPFRKKWPTVVTIYDIIPILFPESQKFLGKLYWPATLKRAAKTSDHILTISEASKRDIVDMFQIDPRKITVTPLAVDLGHFKESERMSNEPYILFVGTLEPRKNVSLLVRAFGRIADQISHKLIIAGRAYKGSEKIEQEIGRLKLEDKVKLISFVDYEKLPGLYVGADLFVWPAIYEGWGLPPMEAMACGTPVIVSNGGSLPEVVGDAGDVIRFTESDLSKRQDDVEFEKQLADKILSVLQDKEKLTQMRQLGLERVKQFSWADVARKTVEVYEKVVG